MEQLTRKGDFRRFSADVQFRLADIYRVRGENKIAERRLARGLSIAQNTPEIWLLPGPPGISRGIEDSGSKLWGSRCDLSSGFRPQSKLTEDEGVLEFVAAEPRFYGLAITAKSARIVVGLGQRAAVEGKIDSYLAGVAAMRGKTESGRALYAMLLEPFPELATKSHWILIRDGKLNLLPWDALVDNSNRYLVETQNISFAPSVSSAILLRNKPPIRAGRHFLLWVVSLMINLAHWWLLFEGLIHRERSLTCPVRAMRF